MVGDNVARVAGDTVDDIVARAAQELREANERRYQLMAEAFPQVVWMANAEGELTYRNARWYEYTGLTPAEADARGWEAAIHAHDLPMCRARRVRALAIGEPFEVEFRFRRGSDSAYRWHLERATPVRDADNRVVEWIACCTDIHDQRLAVEAVRDAHREAHRELERRVDVRTAELTAATVRLTDFLESTSDLIQSAAPDGRLLYVNTAWLTTLGYGRGAVGDLTVLDVVAPDHRDAFAELLRAALAGESVRFADTVFCTTDGRRVVLSGSITRRVEDGQPVATWATFRNVTDRRAAEDAQHRLVTTLEATPDIVAIGTCAGDIIYLNRSGRRALGLAEDADLQTVTTLRFDAFLPHGAREPLCADGGTWSGETTLPTADGSEIPVSQVVVAHRSAQGGVWFLSTIMRDMSEFKRLDRMKGEFVSTVSHELRTPLTSIRGALGLLDGGVAGALSEQARELVRIAMENIERLSRLVNDMLDLDKMEAGKLELRLVSLVPDDVVSAAVEGIRAMAEQQGIRLVQRIATQQSFTADRDRIIQVLTNLLSNAIKFSPAGSVIEASAIEIGTGATALAGPTQSGAHASVPSGGGHTNGRAGRAGRTTPRGARAVIRFAVENPGPGILPSDVPRLFGRFQQLDSSDSRRQRGTGLGLAISKAIVEQHGGNIGVASQPNVSTIFWFELPAAPRATTPTARIATKATPT